MFPETGLRTRIATGLVGISLATALAFGLGAYWAADSMEVLVLEDNIGELALRAATAISAGQTPPLPDETWYFSRRQSDRDLAPEFRQLQNGSHHEVVVGDRDYHVWVQPLPNDRLFLIYDLTEIEEYESRLVVFLVSIGVIVGALAFGTGLWLTPWIARPVTTLADHVTKLPPDAQRLGPTASGDADLAILAEAIDTFLGQNHELVERERAFSGMASHELRNPVASIMATLDLIELKPQPPELAQPLRRIRRSTQRMEKLIEILLDLARRQQEGHDAQAQCHPAALIREIVNDHLSRMGKETRQIELELDEDLRLEVKPAMFEVVANNLINNALDHSTGPKIYIRLVPTDLTVKSKGATTQPERTGSLGLSIVDVICKRQGWSFEYNVDPPFTTVTVRLA